MVKELSASQEEQAQKEIFKKYASLTTKLLEPAEQLSDVWRRAMYSIPEKQTERFYNDLLESNLNELLTRHINPETESEYTSETPHWAYILVEDIDHTKAKVPRGFKATDLEVGLHYETITREFNDIRIVLTSGKTQATSYVYSSKEAETGYEGHDWRIQNLNIDQLQTFYEIVKKNVKT